MAFTAFIFAFSNNPGITAAPTAARMPMMATTIRSSMRVKPEFFLNKFNANHYQNYIGHTLITLVMNHSIGRAENNLLSALVQSAVELIQVFISIVPEGKALLLAAAKLTCPDK